MTTTYGYSTTRNGVSIRVAAYVNGGQVTITPTLSATIPIYDESNSVSWSGAASGSYGGPAIRIGSSSAGRTASNAPLTVNSSGHTSFTFTLGRTTSPQSKSLTFNLAGINYAGATLTATVDFVIPALPPATPTNGSSSAAYLLNGQWTSDVSWTVPAGATGIKLWRWDANSDRYALIANLGAVGSYRDTTLEVDNRYWYGVEAVNAGGTSGFLEWSGPIPPAAAPTNLTASRSGTSVVGSFTNQSRRNPSFEIQDSTNDGTTWTIVQTIARDNHAVGQKIDYALSGLNPTLPHRIRVRAIGEHPAPNGTPSAWSAPSGTVVIITKPNPPTGLTSGVVEWGSAVPLSALPATTVLPDGSSLSAVEWQHRALGASAWTTITNTSPSGLVASVSGYASGSSIEHRVRVKGAHADWSDWSAVALVKLSRLPVSSFTSPTGSTLQGDTLTVTASGHDPDGGTVTHARYWLTTPGGSTLASARETSAVTAPYTFPAKLADGQQVIAWVQHREPDGLWSTPAQLAQTVAYIGPAELNVETRWDVDHALLLWEWESQADPSKPAPSSVDVYALIDGQRVEMATGLAPMGAWPMRLAPLVDTTYQLAVRSDLPSTTWQTVHVAASAELRCPFVINGGPGYSIAAMGRSNVDFVRVGGRARTAADGWANSPYPREVVTEQLSDVRDIELSTFEGINSAEAFEWVQSQPHDLWYRDPTGASWPCTMTQPTRTVNRWGGHVRVGFTVARIGGGPTIDEAIEASMVTADTIYADLIPEP